jgi:hypothetical protein
MILRWFLWRGISVALFEGSQNFIMCSYPGRLRPGALLCRLLRRLGEWLRLTSI